MNLGQLKQYLAKYPPDMHDMEVYMMSSPNGHRHVEPLCFIGYYPMPKCESIVLGTLTEMQRMVEAGEMEKPKGYIDPSDSDPYIFGL